MARTPPKAYPSFDDWQQEALNNSAAAESQAASLVNDYIEWEAFAFWVRLIVESARGIPEDLKSVVIERCPDFVVQVPDKNPRRSYSSTQLWRDLLAWIEAHHFATNPNTSLDALRAAARSHLRGERIAAYWARCSSMWKKRPPSPYPTFEEWLRQADVFVTK